MNISPRENMLDGDVRRLDAPVPLRPDHSRHRDRHHDRGHGGVAAHRIARGHRHVLRLSWARTMSSSRRQRQSRRHPGPAQGTQAPPDRSRICGRHPPLLQHRGGCLDLACSFPRLPAARIITAKVPGYDTDQLSIVGRSRRMRSISRRTRFRSRAATSPTKRTTAARRLPCSDTTSRMRSFPNGDAVNRTFMMDGAEYTCVGVFEKAKGGFLGRTTGHRRSTCR